MFCSVPEVDNHSRGYCLAMHTLSTAKGLLALLHGRKSELEEELAYILHRFAAVGVEPQHEEPDDETEAEVEDDDECEEEEQTNEGLLCI